jgi:hypothetical protein
MFVNMVEDLAFRKGDDDRRRKLAYSQQIAAALLGTRRAPRPARPLHAPLSKMHIFATGAPLCGEEPDAFTLRTWDEKSYSPVAPWAWEYTVLYRTERPLSQSWTARSASPRNLRTSSCVDKLHAKAATRGLAHPQPLSVITCALWPRGILRLQVLLACRSRARTPGMPVACLLLPGARTAGPRVNECGKRAVLRNQRV